MNRRVIISGVILLVFLSLFLGTASAFALQKIAGEPDAQPGGCSGIGCGPGSGSSVAYSPSGSYVAVAAGDSASGVYATFYKVVGDDYTKLTTNAPDTQPNGRGQAVAWHPDSTFVVIVGQISPYVTLYERVGDTFIKRSVSGVFPTGSGGFATDVSWDSDGSLVAVAHGQGTSSDTLAIYSFAGTTLTYQQDLATAGGGQVIQAEFSPDGDYVVAGQTNSPYLFWWSETGGVFTPRTSPTPDPGGTCFGVAWSEESDRVSCQRTSPSKQIVTYVRTGTTLGDKATFTPTIIPIGGSWQLGGTRLAIAGNDAPYLEIWERTGNSWAFAVAPSSGDQPNGNGLSVDWNPLGDRIVLGATSGDAGGTKQVSFFQTSNTAFPPGAGVAAGAYVPCVTFALNWTLPSGDGIDSYNVTRSTAWGNASFLIPPRGNFTLRLFNDTFPPVSGNVTYRVSAHSSGGWGASSNQVNFTPPNVSTIGSCGLIWGGDRDALAATAGISADALGTTISIVLVIVGTGLGFAITGRGFGAAAGAGAGLLGSIGLGLMPLWSVMLVVVLVVGGFFLAASGSRAARRAGRYR